MQTYSLDLRDRVLRALERGGPTAIARRFEVSRQWVYQVSTRFQSDGARSGLPRGGYRKSRVVDMESTVREWLKIGHQMNKWDLSLRFPLIFAPSFGLEGVADQADRRWR